MEESERKHTETQRRHLLKQLSKEKGPAVQKRRLQLGSCNKFEKKVDEIDVIVLGEVKAVHPEEAACRQLVHSYIIIEKGFTT